MAKYTPMMEQYLHIKEQYQDCILFFQLGDFYEMFFEDAKVASQVLGIALTGRDAGQAERIPMCGIPLHAADNYLPKLIDKGYKVAICGQVENPSEAKGVVKRDVIRIVTPGVHLEEKILDEQKNQYIVTIVRGNDGISYSVCDISTGDFFVSSIQSHEMKIIYNEIIAYDPKEVLITFDDPELRNMFKIAGVYVSDINTNYFNSDFDPNCSFDNHFSKESNVYPNSISPQEKLAVGWLLGYIYATQKRSIYHLTSLQKKERNNRMLLDVNAKRNLELIETMRAKEKKGSLLWVLDKTKTSMGARLLRQWVENPLLTIQEIEFRLDAVEELRDNHCLLEDLQDYFKEIYDIDRLLGRLSYGSANARDLVALKNSLLMVPSIRKVLHELKSPYLKELSNQLKDVTFITEYLERALVDNPPISVKDGGMIKDNFDENLDKYRYVSENGKNWILELERQERDKTKIKSLKIGFNKIFGYFIEITRANLSQVPDNYQRKQTLANAERFITEELKEKEELILKAENSIVDLEHQLFIKIREFVLEHLSSIQTIAKSIATLDVLVSFSIVSIKGGYNRPVFNCHGSIEIKKGRHPVVEHMLQDEMYVPNDVILNHDDQIQLITGPNMAGKSTYMRQVALIVVMGQIGSYVPAESADLTIVDRIFTRIGASDDLSSGQSTFMVEMVEAKEALNEATENSLILLDEIGRGTSTYDGMALAHSIIEYIHEYVKAKTLFSTHYHELTELENRYPRVVNYHVKCIEKDHRVIFLHQVHKGKADKSYGVYVAQIAGMPKQVIFRAKELLSFYEKQFQHQQHAKQLSLLEMVQEDKSSERIVEEDNITEKMQCIQELESMNLVQMTPIEALNYLFELQKKLKN